MAMIKCPECGQEVSDKAAACIHCGAPLNHIDAGHAIVSSNKKNKLVVSMILNFIAFAITCFDFLYFYNFLYDDLEQDKAYLKALLVLAGFYAVLFTIGLVLSFLKSLGARRRKVLAIIYLVLSGLALIPGLIAGVLSLVLCGAGVFIIAPSIMYIAAGVGFLQSCALNEIDE